MPDVGVLSVGMSLSLGDHWKVLKAEWSGEGPDDVGVIEPFRLLLCVTALVARLNRFRPVGAATVSREAGENTSIPVGGNLGDNDRCSKSSSKLVEAS
jgi:hypothetical protein